MNRRTLIAAVASLLLVLLPTQPADAACPVPNAISNGDVADATQIMGNFDALGTCATSRTGSPAAGSLAVFSTATTVGTGNLTGDVTTSDGTTTTLTASGVAPGTYYNATFTVDEKGRVTSASSGASNAGGGALVLISRQILTADATSIDFPSIPADYEDLVLVLQGRGTAPATEFRPLIRFNNDSGANYDYSRWNRWGNVTLASQTSAEISSLPGANASANKASDFTLEIINYKRTTFFKSAHATSSFSQDAAAAGQSPTAAAISWRSTAAINKITLLPSSGAFAVGTVISLYGRQ